MPVWVADDYHLEARSLRLVFGLRRLLEVRSPA